MMMLEAVILTSLVLWLLFYVLNHAELTAKVRAAVLPALPGWLRKLVICPLCVSFWVLAAISLFTGYTPMLLWCPPCVLWMDLGYRRLARMGREGEPK